MFRAATVPHNDVLRAACSKAADHRTVCREIEADPGFLCGCDPGYELVPAAAGGEGQCTDTNECAAYRTLCDRGDLTRNVCTNKQAEGTSQGYECKENIPDECTEENNFGGCWAELLGDVTLTSCMVRMCWWLCELN